MFNAGIRPALNAGLSVSRVGGDAQTKAMKQVAGGLRLDMAAFRELAAFAQFGSSLDQVTQNQLNRGQRLQEILKQGQYAPVTLSEMVIAIYAVTNGFADDIEIPQMTAWETNMLRFMATSNPEIGKEIAEKKSISDELGEKLGKALDSFNATWA